MLVVDRLVVDLPDRKLDPHMLGLDLLSDTSMCIRPCLLPPTQLPCQVPFSMGIIHVDLMIVTVVALW